MKKRLVIIILIILMLTALGVNIAMPYEKSTINTKNSDDITVVIDSGHGGEDGGAVGENGVVESELNLKFAKKLKLIFNLNGYNTVMTRENEDDLADKNLSTVAERKKSDMYKRLDIYNSSVHNVAISIHQNIFPATSCTGSQVFYATKIPTGKTLADNITESITANLQQQSTRESKPTTGSIFLLDNATVPAVLVECGFLSNTEEVKNLCDVNYQRKLVFCIYLGFAKTKL